MADRPSPAGTPRWVKVFGIAALVVIVLFVVLLLVGGPHNPGRHMDAGGGDQIVFAGPASQQP